MTIENVTKRASGAMLLISKADELISPLMACVPRGGDLTNLLAGLELLEEAQKELVKILAQDNDVKEL